MWKQEEGSVFCCLWAAAACDKITARSGSRTRAWRVLRLALKASRWKRSGRTSVPAEAVLCFAKMKLWYRICDCPDEVLRYEEAHTQANLQMNNVARADLWLKQSLLPQCHQDDLRLQVRGDLWRFLDPHFWRSAFLNSKRRPLAEVMGSTRMRSNWMIGPNHRRGPKDRRLMVLHYG